MQLLAVTLTSEPTSLILVSKNIYSYSNYRNDDNNNNNDFVVGVSLLPLVVVPMHTSLVHNS